MERKTENLQKKKSEITDKMIRNYCANQELMLTLHILNTNPQKNSSHFTAIKKKLFSESDEPSLPQGYKYIAQPFVYLLRKIEV